jgi:hypothetical protein
MVDPPDADAGPTPLRLEVVAETGERLGEGDELLSTLRSALVGNPTVRSRYPDADLWLIGVDVLDKEPRPDAWFRAILHDMAGGEVVEAWGYLDDMDGITVLPTNRERLPTEEEHAWAVDLLRHDPELARRLDEGQVTTYAPMPPLASTQTADGSVDRAITVGLRDESGGGVRHRVVAVRTADGEVIEGAAELASSDHDCGSPPGQESASEPGAKSARVRVWRGDERLWDLVVVRPSASSGLNGSGVELRYVDYQQVRVLYRAHVPILNVAYDEPSGHCGPSYRDWFNSEASFLANPAGEADPVPGFRICSAPARTILDTGEGGGSFRGVALWLDGDDLVIVSQLRAGWYRYVSSWRLCADGTIRPRLGFAAVSNPCTCAPHTHHAYWRLDFDIVTADVNQVQEFNDPTLPGQLSLWHTIRYEVHRPRHPASQRRWRVRSTRSPHGYTIVPGPNDGTADEYGVGDVWVLAYRGDEIDDGQGLGTDPAESRAHIERFVSGEMVERQDLVVWYAAHFRHAPGEEPAGGHWVGPDLEPYNWRPPVERGPYIPLAPPPQERGDDDEE